MHTQGLLVPRDDEIIVTALDMMKQGTSSCPDEIFEAMMSLDTNETSYTTLLFRPSIFANMVWQTL